ncbi:F-box only protein 22-like [Bombus affinis]|uniref:F-box only protein 22 isoform X1 n=1 Tax=Bombus terrestris TaxID=30195 RepID=A0A9B0C4I3_BOMTE|nr:F-box only protein 22 isoform X1 [Bombus terrestris]XP_050574297.1 F-box only protein 22-like [Bombus affinis]
MASLSAKRSYEDDDSTLNVKERKKHHTDLYLTYDVLRLVFKYLNWVDLLNASMVCRSWLEVANDEKRTRGGPTTLINSGKKYIKVIEKLRDKPALGLVFKGLHKRSIRQDCLCQVLPQSCEIVTLSTFGILIENAEMERVLQKRVYAFLPEIPDVTMKVITIASRDDFTQYYQQMRLAFVKYETNRSKCLLLFCNQAGRALAQRTARILQLCNGKVRPSVWGGVVKDLYVCNSKNLSHDERCFSYAFCVGIIIVGEIDSWSIVMDDSCNTKELVEQKLESFKNDISLRKHSIGYMFACCERGTNMFNERDVESTIFKKLFPEVPLVGCFGDGEFGENTISSKSLNYTEDYWYHERSTVFLIITYGQKLT